ncbi:MAG TPA: flagellar FliJ family protein [Anaerohalosphaeraceae bacterium]|jgi:flagellar export protein FliJ|nr:flagellar FliJ family protein [Anaerohalosphaeraceae bacterium]HRT49442.1 flagellar FliJ family protein [Anaerohalosphaeraceae bacterium]HRT85394.1 flagellar FliJ family protein [Anaerohalosphaeraceae bacterium]
MKRFAWRLQRVLDLKIKEEEVKREALMAVTEQAAAVRGRILMERAAFRRTLSELRGRDGWLRLTEQEMLLQYGHVFEARMRQLESRLAELEEQRRAKIAEVLEVRKFRKGLEKLREKARAEFMKNGQKLEQNEMDEHTTIRFARALMEQS